MTQAAPITVGDRISSKMVAQIISEREWTAKVGPADQTDEEIMRTGDTLPKNVAAHFFRSYAERQLTYIWKS